MNSVGVEHGSLLGVQEVRALAGHGSRDGPVVPWSALVFFELGLGVLGVFNRHGSFLILSEGFRLEILPDGPLDLFRRGIFYDVDSF